MSANGGNNGTEDPALLRHPLVFGYGVRASAAGNRPLRIAGSLLVVYGVLGFAAPFAPMHQRGVDGTITDLMHINLTIVTVLLMFATVFLLLLFGALAARDGSRVESNLPTPGLGIIERICVGVFLLWVIVLAMTLLGAVSRRYRDDSIATDATPPEADRAPGCIVTTAILKRDNSGRAASGLPPAR